MKYCINFTLFVIIAIIPLKLNAASFSAGASAWYAWGEPSFKNEFMGKNDDTSSKNKYEAIDDAAMIYGALFALQITDDLALGAVFSYGTGWGCKADYMFYSGTYLHMYRTMDKMQRYEGDLTFNYRLTDMFKLFFGWKYYGFRGDGDYEIYFEGGSFIGSGTFNIEADSTGPGAGLTLKMNLVDNLYLISTLSGIYMKEKSVTDIKGYTNETNKEYYDSAGPNATINFTYVVPETTASLSLGGRYQYLVNLESHTKNQLYGLMLSAIYSF
jgi:hypothetical protein